MFDPNVVPSSDATIPYAPWEKIDTMKGPSTYIFSVGVDATRDYGWAANNGHRDRGARQIKDRMKRHNNNNRYIVKRRPQNIVFIRSFSLLLSSLPSQLSNKPKHSIY